MNKRIFSLVLALVLALASLTVAFAESSPVIATVTTATVASVVSASGVELPADFTVTANDATAATTALAATIASALQAGDVAGVFGDEAAAAISQVILGKANASDLKVEEVFPLTVANYSETYGDIIVTLDLPADYASDAVMVALIGYYDANGELVWIVAEAEVVAGQLVLTLDAATLAANTDGEFTVALLGA